MTQNIDDLENLVWLVENDGEVSIGRIGPVRCAAVACDEDSQLAALAKQPDESFSGLLARLDAAIQKAWDEDIYTDEINP